MIIVKLQGGLGNQMFQYAVGRQLSIINNTTLKLDLSFIKDKKLREHFTLRDFELEALNINCEYSSLDDVKHFANNNIISKIKRKFANTKLLTEKGKRFQSEVLDSGKEIYLDGYWQSEKYFEKIRTELLSEFSLKKSSLDKLNNNESLKQIKELIESSNSIAIHFRRGDYVTDTVTNQFHGTCSIQYYQDAIKLLAQKVQSPHFFLFSDDPEWVLNNRVADDFPTTVVTTLDMHFDMYLMSLCKHNIIANSSFSWWGAWLNRNSEKLVIAPEKWFADCNMNDQTIDLIPEKWIRI